MFTVDVKQQYNKMPKIVAILTFMSRKNSILDKSEPEKKSWISWYFYTYEHLRQIWVWKKFYNLMPWAYWLDALADLSIHLCWFCRVAVHLR